MKSRNPSQRSLTQELKQDALMDYRFNRFNLHSIWVMLVLIAICWSALPLHAQDTTPPSSPSIQNYKPAAETQMNLTWTASTDNVGVAGYDVLRDGVVVGTTTNLTYLDTGLTPGRIYGFVIRAFDAAGNQKSSSTKRFLMPTCPEFFTVDNISSTSVSLSWAGSANLTVTSYNIYRDGVLVGSTPNLTYTDTNLAPGRVYNYKVAAVVSVIGELTRSIERTVRTSGTALGTASPIIYFSDLTSGPKSGWSLAQPNRGCAVTVWGVNLGELRNNSTLTVCGATLSQDSDFAEWGLFNAPSPFLQRITFWLNHTCVDGDGTISVTVNGVQSNTLPFTTRAGRIRFVDLSKPANTAGSFENPWNSLTLLAKNYQAGDACYLRGGLYAQSYNGGKDVLWMRTTEGATAAAPLAITSYPGESAILDALANAHVNFYRGIKTDGAYITVSKLGIRAYGAGADIGSGGRFVGNDVIGTLHAGTVGTGIINTAGSSAWVLGNQIRGGRSADRFDHAIYPGGDASVGPLEVAWNYIHDNSHERGPMISLNHQENRCPWPLTVKAHYVHSNIIDCTNFPSRGIVSFDMSWDPQSGEDVMPEPAYIFNNLLVNCGMTRTQSANGYNVAGIELNNGRHYVFNNSIHNCSGTGITSGDGSGQIEAKIFNNIIHMDPTETRLMDSITEYVQPTYDYSSTPMAVSSNLYFGIGPYQSRNVNFNDAQAVTGDPLWNHIIQLDFTPKAGSPALSAAYPDIETLLNDDALLGLPKPASVVQVIGRLSGRAGIDAELVGAISYGVVPNPLIKTISFGWLQAGQLGLTIESIPGNSYTLETGTDLTDFQPQQTVVATGTTLQFTISTNGAPRLFARVKMN